MSVFHFAVPAWQLIVRSIVIYLVFLVAFRVFGKREVGQFTLYDLVLVLLVANAVQPAMTGPDNSLGGGLIIIGVLVLLNYGLSRLDRYRLFHRLLSPVPRVIIRDGRYLPGPMRREGVDRSECEMAMREHGVDKVDDVQLGVLEADGTISIVPKDSRVIRTRRTVRYVRH